MASAIWVSITERLPKHPGKQFVLCDEQPADYDGKGVAFFQDGNWWTDRVSGIRILNVKYWLDGVPPTPEARWNTRAAPSSSKPASLELIPLDGGGFRPMTDAEKKALDEFTTKELEGA